MTPVRMYDLEGAFLQDFTSIEEAAVRIRVQPFQIEKVINGQYLEVGGFQFRRFCSDTLDSLPPIYEHTNQGKPCRAIAKYWEGRLIAVYNSIAEASHKCALNKGSIKITADKQGTYKGFTFKWIT